MDQVSSSSDGVVSLMILVEVSIRWKICLENMLT